MLRTICDPGINWNWYLQGEFNDQALTVEVLFYDRWHKYNDPKHPACEHLEGFRSLGFVETPDRVLIGVRVGTKLYKVLNPQNIFKYRDFSKMVKEV